MICQCCKGTGSFFVRQIYPNGNAKNEWFTCPACQNGSRFNIYPATISITEKQQKIVAKGKGT